MGLSLLFCRVSGPINEIIIPLHTTGIHALYISHETVQKGVSVASVYLHKPKNHYIIISSVKVRDGIKTQAKVTVGSSRIGMDDEAKITCSK